MSDLPESVPRASDPQPAAPPRRRRALKIALGVLALLIVAIAALVGYALSERGLSAIVARIVAQSGGHITVEEPTGSVAGTMHFRRITWHGVDITVTADDVVVDWNPGALWSKRLSVKDLGARRVDIEIKPSTGATSPPTDLRLPLAVDIAQLAIAEMTWRTGPRGNRITGLQLGYSGDEKAHRITRLRLVSDFGALSGAATIGATDAIPIDATATLAGDGPLAGANAVLKFNGPVARIGITGTGTMREAALSLQAVATPFASAPFASVAADLTGVDAKRFLESLPSTRARVHLEAQPRGTDIGGTVALVNEEPGPIDAERVPVSVLSSEFILGGDVLALKAIDASLPGGGGARGDGQIQLDGAHAVKFALDVRNLDLVRIHSKLVPTRLSGRLQADATAERQTIEGDIRDRDIGLAFAAVIANERVEVSRFRATTAGGSLAGSARVALNDANEFSVDAQMQRLDPSKFAAVPQASLNGTVSARGVLRPQWRADADVKIAAGSSIAQLPVSGTLKGSVAPRTLRDAMIDIALASAKVHASGGAGSKSDRLAYSIDVPSLAEIAAVIPSSVPRPLRGELHAKGSAAIVPDRISGDVELRARALQAGGYAVQTLQAQASIAPPASGGRNALSDRALKLDVDATKIVLPSRAIDAVQARLDGSLARHHASLSLKAKDIDVALAVDGSLANADEPSRAAWSGTLLSLANEGAVPVRLRAPAKLAARDGYVSIGDAHIDAAGGTADIRQFIWDHGRITTQGSVSDIAVAKAAALAGVELPVTTTIVAAGEWSIVASPRLNGTFSVRRERGDVLADLGSDAGQPQGLGISTLTIAGKFVDDALDATATFASERAGNATATVAVGASGASRGTIDPSAALQLALRGDLASLAVFQPWLGTSVALNGRAHLDVTATGTVGNPLWSGTVTGEALRVDAPQYGLNITDGRLRAHLQPNGVALDELYFAGGDGSFTASGLLALPGKSSTATTQVAWKAERFRATNRPDLRLVLNGNGTVALREKRLALSGEVTVVEGHLEYEPAPTGELASDIVIKGQTPSSRREAAKSSAVPLALDLNVDLGNALTFTGEGIDTGLAGRVRVTTSESGALLGRGTIRTVNGTYIAFGQKLTIDRGRLIFDGPIENPALDVVALRKNLPVEAGVELTGTVKVPQVRVTSNPPVPENEALSWLITGQGLGNASGAEFAALSAASSALLGRNGKPITARIAQSIGVDDISLKSTGGTNGTQGTAASQVVVFGKRISDRLTLGYEQGLSLASSAVRLEYALSRQVTLRAEAGQVSGVGIVYRRSFR